MNPPLLVYFIIYARTAILVSDNKGNFIQTKKEAYAASFNPFICISSSLSIITLLRYGRDRQFVTAVIILIFSVPFNFYPFDLMNRTLSD